MAIINFSKMVASGNDFVVVERASLPPALNLARLAKSVCDRKFGIGADGLLVLEKIKDADARMRIFNADGSEANMCGNGARCVAYYLAHAQGRNNCDSLTIKTRAGLLKASVRNGQVKLRLTDPTVIRFAIPVEIAGRLIKVNFINTGVPHAVVFVEGLASLAVAPLGEEIRYHKTFAPQGTNANFVEVLARDTIRVRTYERGVEDETLACGTGTVASALVWAAQSNMRTPGLVKVITQGKETLKVYFSRNKNTFTNVWLEGKARIVFQGELQV
ncbi:MAG: diaminopimelate epimerase [Candidatus Omnitrophica bacterium]|nr:diaminopimelate epimerase [Candidatus Omnitrophota bacterium]